MGDAAEAHVLNCKLAGFGNNGRFGARFFLFVNQYVPGSWANGRDSVRVLSWLPSSSKIAA